MEGTGQLPWVQGVQASMWKHVMSGAHAWGRTGLSKFP